MSGKLTVGRLRGLDYAFDDPVLLKRALTHRSVGPDNNERLEFLGDALLGMLVAEFLYENFPAADEGQLTRTRATLVNGDTLADIARALELGEALVLGEGEQKSGGWRRDSILANALEALIGAIYLDGGIDACRAAIAVLFSKQFAAADPQFAVKDPKTALQEYLQARALELPVYETAEVVGPSHDQLFTVICRTNAMSSTVTATGRSRRKAEQAAASAVMEQLTEKNK